MKVLDYMVIQRETFPYDSKLVKYLTNKYYSKRGRLLDVGCGIGKYVKLFSVENVEAVGIDNEIDLGKERYPFEDGTFDHVFSKSFLEHVVDTEYVAREMCRILKPGGTVVIMVPEYLKQSKTFWDEPTHLKPLTKVGLFLAFKREGFKEIECSTFYQFPWVWDRPYLKYICKLIALLPNNPEKINMLIYHSKRPMLLLSGRKPYPGW